MSVAVLVVTDGRHDYLRRTIASAKANLLGPFTEWWMYDDTGDADYRAQLAVEFPGYRHINGGPRQGFGGAIRTAWAAMVAESSSAWVLHLEADFEFNRMVDVYEMITVLDCNPQLAQLVLRRQPWNDAERAAGGIVEQHPDDYTDMQDGDLAWLEHNRFFSTNPCLYRRELMLRGWPDGAQSEGHFGIGLVLDGYRFGYWGSRTDAPWVTHIGDERAGCGY